jgi:hypothetical protein
MEFLLSAPLPPLDHLAIEICVTVGKWTLSLGVTFESSHQDYPQDYGGFFNGSTRQTTSASNHGVT